VDIDILKPSTGYHTVERPSQLVSLKTTPDKLPSPGISTPDVESHSAYIEPVSEGEDEDEMAVAPAKDEPARAGLKGEEVAEAIAFRERTFKDRMDAEAAAGSTMDGKTVLRVIGEEEPGTEARLTPEPTPSPKPSTSKAPEKPRALSIDPLAPSSAFDMSFRERLRVAHEKNIEREKVTEASPSGILNNETNESLNAEGSTSAQPPEPDRELVRHWRAPAGKRIAVPVRVEPKVYFAAERTFLVPTIHANFL
jgi:hypothetical protein